MAGGAPRSSGPSRRQTHLSRSGSYPPATRDRLSQRSYSRGFAARAARVRRGLAAARQRAAVRPHIGVERGAGWLAFQRFIDRAPLIARERLEGVANRDELVVGRVLLRELRGYRVRIR